jgi:hypothetical protein
MAASCISFSAKSNHMKRKFLFILGFTGFLVYQNSCCGQQVFASSGGSGKAHAWALNWTVGEPVTTTVGKQVVFTQGFQQAKLTVSSIYKQNEFNMQLAVYPNPTAGQLSISLKDATAEFLVSISNQTGAVSFNQALSLGPDPHIINLSNYTQGVYFVRVLNKNRQVVQMFKVVKF